MKKRRIVTVKLVPIFGTSHPLPISSQSRSLLQCSLKGVQGQREGRPTHPSTVELPLYSAAVVFDGAAVAPFWRALAK